jgi:hypothetical protein
MKTMAREGRFVSNGAFASESAVETIFDAASFLSPLVIMVGTQTGREETFNLLFARVSAHRRETPTARERWQRMAEQARERLATSPDYPDDPRNRAEQEEVTRALMDGQVRSLREP